MLPEGWQCSKLSSCDIAVIDGDRGKSYPNGDDFSDQGHCLFLSAKNVTKAGFVFDECQFISEAKHRALRKGGVIKGDMVLTTRGTVGNIAYLLDDKTFSAVRINSGMVVLRNRNARLDTDFLHLVMRSPLIQKQVDQMNFGSAQPQLTVQIINDFVLLVPPLPEQRKIAEILSTWDRAIATMEKLIANARTQKHALVRRLFIEGRNGGGRSGEWRAMRLDEFAVVTMGSSPPSSAYNATGQGLPLIQGNADVSSRSTSPRFHTTMITQTCAVGDIIFSVRAPVGEIARAAHRACLGRGVAGIRPRLASDDLFLFHALIDAEKRWAKLSQGSTFQAVNSKDLKSFEMFAPVVAEDRARIGTILDNAYRFEDTMIRQQHHLRQEKSALMQQLLTGKRRVKIETQVPPLREAAA